MMVASKNLKRGFTLPELLVAMSVMGALAWTISLIYFSVLGVYNKNMWRLRPYDEATKAVERISSEVREAMVLDTALADAMIFIVPEKDANNDNVLVDTGDGLSLSQGDWVAFYLSDETGAIYGTGHCLWKAVKPKDSYTWVPRIKIAEDIHPELNPIDPDTGQPRPMFKYWPDATRLWGVEMWITSTSVVRGQLQPQTAHTESYLRNL
ncbi:MAG: prepilin-type N-terminal cleavage/methylation domain-containing protein [Armatimonadota bacterium]|nr:MAG: prepilin-type N-terminal cleavage/methylation domain-containing protein [Armatimonadota bacterium]